MEKILCESATVEVNRKLSIVLVKAIETVLAAKLQWRMLTVRLRRRGVRHSFSQLLFLGALKYSNRNFCRASILEDKVFKAWLTDKLPFTRDARVSVTNNIFCTRLRWQDREIGRKTINNLISSNGEFRNRLAGFYSGKNAEDKECLWINRIKFI